MGLHRGHECVEELGGTLPVRAFRERVRTSGKRGGENPKGILPRDFAGGCPVGRFRFCAGACCTVVLLGRGRAEGGSGRAALHPLWSVKAKGKGLAAYVLLRVEGLGVTLQTQVVVPRLREALVLLVQLHQVHVVVADDVAAPLLHAYIVVSVGVGV